MRAELDSVSIILILLLLSSLAIPNCTTELLALYKYSQYHSTEFNILTIIHPILQTFSDVDRSVAEGKLLVAIYGNEVIDPAHGISQHILKATGKEMVISYKYKE